MGSELRSTTERLSYNAIAERAGGIWFISVPDVPEALTSTRRPDAIECVTRAAIAQALHVPGDSFDVGLSFRVSSSPSMAVAEIES